MKIAHQKSYFWVNTIIYEARETRVVPTGI